MADKETLIRRAYFDIIGLPPTPEQVRQFAEDTAPNAFEKVIDELLECRPRERLRRDCLGDLAQHGMPQATDFQNGHIPLLTLPARHLSFSHSAFRFGLALPLVMHSALIRRLSFSHSAFRFGQWLFHWPCIPHS